METLLQGINSVGLQWWYYRTNQWKAPVYGWQGARETERGWFEAEQTKMFFLQPSIEYFDHIIDKDRLHPTEKKVWGIMAEKLHWKYCTRLSSAGKWRNVVLARKPGHLHQQPHYTLGSGQAWQGRSHTHTLKIWWMQALVHSKWHHNITVQKTQQQEIFISSLTMISSPPSNCYSSHSAFMYQNDEGVMRSCWITHGGTRVSFLRNTWHFWLLRS